MPCPLVSVIIPCYNAEQWISDAIDSVIHQTWSNKEIIVIDDGSIDQSLKIVKTFNFPFIKVISQENGGASAARNRALQIAQGEFIQYLDADDLLSRDKIEAQVLLLQQHSPGKLAVCGTIHFFDGNHPDDGILETGFPFLVDSDDPLNWLLKLLGADGQGGMVPQSAWLTPRYVADAAGDWNEQLSLDDDGEYFARVVLNSAGIRRCESVVSYYRKYHKRNNLSSGNSRKDRLSSLRSLDLKSQHLLAKTSSPESKFVLAKLYMENAVQCYPIHRDLSSRALKMARSLGLQKVNYVGGQKGHLIAKFLGWKAARLLSYVRYGV